MMAEWRSNLPINPSVLKMVQTIHEGYVEIGICAELNGMTVNVLYRHMYQLEMIAFRVPCYPNSTSRVQREVV